MASGAGLSAADRRKLEDVEALVAGGERNVTSLVSMLDDASWAVRRGVVSALARLGDMAVEPLCFVLKARRFNEARLAACVDALVASRGDVDPSLLRLADQSDDPAVLADIAQVLGRRKSAAATSALGKMVAHANDNVAVGAIEALGRIGGAAAVEPLLGALALRQFFRTFPAVDALGRIGDPRAIGPLAELLQEAQYASEAVKALGRTGQLGAIAPLALLLASPRDAVVRGAAVAISELVRRHEDRGGARERAVRELRATATFDGSRLAACLEGADASEQEAMCGVLASLGGDSAMALFDLLEREGGIAESAARALVGLGRDIDSPMASALVHADSARRARILPLVAPHRANVSALTECLADADPTVRAKAAEILGRIGDPSAVPALFAILGDRDARVSQSVVAAIQSLGGEDSRERAFEAARASDIVTRRAALRIVSYFAVPSALDILLEALADADEKIRDTALQGLALMETPRALDAVLAASSNESPRTRAAAMRALGRTNRAHPVIDALARGLTDEDAWVRYYAAQALGRLRAVDATDLLVARLADDAGQVHVAVLEALAHLDDPRAAAALAKASGEADPDVRRAAILGLGVTRRSDALPHVLRAAADPDAATRLVAVGALDSFDGPEVVPALRVAAMDPDTNVHRAAIGALGGRGGRDAMETLVALASDGTRGPYAEAALANAAPGRIEVIVAALDHADTRRAQLLVSALGRMHTPPAERAIAAVLEAGSVVVRREAANALAAIGTTAAVSALARAEESDTDPEVRRIAAAAVERIR